MKWYYPNISFTLNEYVDLLLDDNTDKFRRGISKLLLNIFNKEKGPYEIIKECLESGRHKIIVFIDDFDRLGAEEIKEVLRLIRNTANLPFVQFIVTYDKEYVCNTLKANGIDKSELYLEKFFNVEISLPKSEERIICDALLTRISKTINTIIWGIPEEDTRIHDMVYYRSNDYTNSVIDCLLVPKILFTIRDVVRFNNSFYLLLKTYKGQNVEMEIEFQDLFYLELLHYRYASIYFVLWNDPFSILELNGNLLLLKKDVKETITKFCTTNQNEDVGYDILYYLFSHSRRTNSIANLRCYSRYFMYRLDKKILTTSEFLMLENIEEVDKLYKDKYPLEFENCALEILTKTIYESDKLLYARVYKIIKLILLQTEHRGLRDEVSRAVIVHLSKLCCLDNRHLEDMLKLFNFIDFNSKTIPYFDVDKFLLSILYKDNLAVKL